jgi:tripartite-type tricarboxylate transporter receptor subunit TctC
MSMSGRTWGYLRRAIVFAFAIGIPVVATGQATDYPTRPIQVVIPFGPGAVNTACMAITEKMAESLGQPMVLINKPGAGGAIGTQAVAIAPADGYTLLAAVPAFVTLPLSSEVPYKSTDFVPIGQFARSSHYLVVKDDFPAKSLQELFAMVKSRPGQIAYGGSGVGGTAYLLVESLKMDRGLDTQFIPFPVETAAITAVLGGHIQFGIFSATAIMGQLKSGSLRALATLSSERDPQMPNLPTTAEQGFPELASTLYFTLVAPAKTPAPVIRKLQAAMERAVQDPQLQEKLSPAATIVYFRSGTDTAMLFDSESKKWASMGKRVGSGR